MSLVVYGGLGAAIILTVAVGWLNILQGNGGLDVCQVAHSLETCLYALR